MNIFIKKQRENTRWRLYTFWYKYFMYFILFWYLQTRDARLNGQKQGEKNGVAGWWRKKKLNLNGIMFHRKLRCLIPQILHQDAWIIHKALRTEFTKNEKSLNTGISLLSFRWRNFFIFFFTRLSFQKQSELFFSTFPVHYSILSPWRWAKKNYYVIIAAQIIHFAFSSLSLLFLSSLHLHHS